MPNEQSVSANPHRNELDLLEFILGRSRICELTRRDLEDEFGVGAFPYDNIIYGLLRNDILNLSTNGYVLSSRVR